MFTRLTLFAISILTVNCSFSQSIISCNQTTETLNSTNITISQSYPSGSISGCYSSVPFITNNSAVAAVNNSDYTITFSPAIQQVDFEMIGISRDSNDTFIVNVNGVDPSTDANTSLSTNCTIGNSVFDNSNNILQSHDTGIVISGNQINLAQNGTNSYSEGGGTLTIKNSVNGISSVNLVFTETGGAIFPPDSAAFEVWLKQVLSVDDFNNELFKIHPNPTSNITYINLPRTSNKAIVEIYSLTGKKISQTKFTNTQEQIKLDISHLANGMYLLKITTNKGIGLKKLIKQL